MDADLSLVTLQSVAFGKVVLVATLAVVAALLWRRPRPWAIAALASASTAVFSLIIAWPLARMWQGSAGDEAYMLAFVGRVMFRGFWGDFYYDGLPVFYPPLYFWGAGLLGKLLRLADAVAAMKAALAVALAAWFAGTYAVQRFARRAGIAAASDPVTASPWFAVAVPLGAFFLLDFSDVIVKPYKAIAGLGVCMLLGLFAEAVRAERWRSRHVAFFGLFGGLLFLTYYLWWFMAIPALFLLAVAAVGRKRGVGRVTAVGAVMFAVAAGYVVPLFWSYRQGIENWQAYHFVPVDFATFLPTAIDWRLPLFLAGIAGLVLFRGVPFLRAQLLLVAASYLFQFLNIVLFLAGGKPLQAAQPFRWLVTPAIAVGAAYLLVHLGRRFAVRWDRGTRIAAAALLLLSTLPLWPMTFWLDDPAIQARMEADLRPSGGAWLAGELRRSVPDWAERTWLASGLPELNGSLPIDYAIAHNAHYSHPAARFGERLAALEALSRAEGEAFASALEAMSVDALLLYRDPTDEKTVPFSLWVDAYPNGGKEVEIRIPLARFESLGWRTALDVGDWIVLVEL